MKNKSELIEEMVSKITIESTKKIIEGINLESLDISNKKLIFSKIFEFDGDISSKLKMIYKVNEISDYEELKEHIANIIKIRAINRTRRIDLGHTENRKRKEEWLKLETLVNKIQKISTHYERLPKAQKKMIDECIDNVKKQLLMMSIKELDKENIMIKNNLIKKLDIWNK